jgi:LysR family hydrogen peroxide-inducible transcriptional activator
MTTIRQLEYITAIDDHGGFQAAADSCHVTQPRLSAQVRQLEELLDVQLFERGRKPVLEAPLGDTDTLPLFEDPFMLAVPRGHRLADRKRIREADLAGEAVLLLDDGHCLRDQALSVCSSAGASELGDFRASSLTTLVHMAASGAGVTLLPALATRARAALDRDLALVPFVRPVPKRTIGLAWRKTSPRGDEFAELAPLFRPDSKRAA